MLKICRQVTPQLDISYFMTAIEVEPTKLELSPHTFKPGDISIYTAEVGHSRVTIGTARSSHIHYKVTEKLARNWSVLVFKFAHWSVYSLNEIESACIKFIMMSKAEDRDHSQGCIPGTFLNQLQGI